MTHTASVSNEAPDRRADALHLIRDSAQSFVKTHGAAVAMRKRRCVLPGFDEAIFREMVALGWIGALIDEKRGGIGLGFRELAAILEETSRGLLAEPMTSAAVLAARTLHHSDRIGSRDALLASIAAGKALVAVAWQEDAMEANPGKLGASATAAGAGFRLTGRKVMVAGAGAATEFIVSAKLGDAIGLFILPAATKGLVISNAWAADGTPICDVHLDDVALDADALLASPGVGLPALSRAVDEATVMVCAELVGVMDEALGNTLDYVRTRVQFDRPIGSNQALQHWLVDLYAQSELSRASLNSAIEAIENDRLDPRERERHVSRAKARCSDAANRITRDAIQLHGAIGITDEFAIGLYLKRAIVLAARFGTASFHRRRFSRLRR